MMNMRLKKHIHLRAQAMTELVVCLLPYCIMILCVILLGQLSLGKQESVKAVAWSASVPGAQSTDEINSRFFVNGAGTAQFTEETGYEPSADATTEEPVLPYTESDIEAVITRVSNRATSRVSVEGGEVVVDSQVEQTVIGGYLEQRGIDERAGDIATALGSWLEYNRSNTTFTYSLHRGAETLHGEDENAGELREEFVIGGGDNGAFSLYSASIKTDGERGYHIADDYSVDTDELETFDVNIPMTAPVIGESDFNFWDKDYSP